MLPTSHDLLASTMDVLDALAAAGKFDTTITRSVGDACVVLGFDDLAERASRILVMTPGEDVFAGAIMNFTPDAEAIRRLRQLSDRDVLEREFPPFRRSDVEEAARSQNETSLAWERRYDEALAVARAHPRLPHETSMVAEIASTAAVLGDFAICEELLRDEVLRPGEAYSVRIVLAIEYARTEWHSESERVVTGLTPRVQGWESIHLALGLAGRRPWAGYPYADY